MAGRGFVVDKAGRGDFTSIQAACDALYARGGGGRVWIRNGTYNENIATNASHHDLVVEGESWDTVIDGGSVNAHALEIAGDRCLIKTLSIKSTGGAGNTKSALYMSGDTCVAQELYIPDSDDHGVYVNGSDCKVLYCYTNGCDGNGIYVNQQWSLIHGNNSVSNTHRGIYMDTGADNGIVTSNKVVSNGGGGLYIQDYAENCVMIGNRATSNTHWDLLDQSGTSTVADNDTT
tara:strand:+ start:1175 stop:1873 length:699 start_codon:yes stop_codon:yes gene_type:complete